MRKTMQSCVFSVALIFGAVALTGCEILENQEELIEDVLPDDQNPRPDIDHPERSPWCYDETFYQPEATIVKKIDFLFVVDTSGSLNAEREQIADGVDAFLDAIPADVDAQFGVMLAHAGSRSGRLYRKDNSVPYVLSTDEFSVDDIRAHLRYRMRNPAGESVTDGGEAGLYSLYNAFNETELSESQGHGFFREDSALVISFVADENDICARYPAGVTPVFDPNLKEGPAFDAYCDDVTPESVLDRVRAFSGDRPSVVSGIIYNPLSDFPHTGENEIGYGYLEMIQLANGPSIDLAGDHLHQGLEQIGILSTKRLDLITEIPINAADNPVDPNSFIVQVDGVDVGFNYLHEISEVHLTGEAGRENSEVYISYCEPTPFEEAPTQIMNLQVFSITSTTVTLSWETDLLANSAVEYELYESGVFQMTPIENASGTFTHQVTVTGLDPNTIYSLKAVSGSISGQNAPTKSNMILVQTRR